MRKSLKNLQKTLKKVLTSFLMCDIITSSRGAKKELLRVLTERPLALAVTGRTSDAKQKKFKKPLDKKLNMWYNKCVPKRCTKRLKERGIAYEEAY